MRSEPFQGDELKERTELRSRYNERSKKVVSKTVGGKTSKAVKKAREAAEADGWRFAKKNKKSVRLEKDKDGGELLEDEVWCIMYKMGFTSLSTGRNLRVNIKAKDYRQIDVLVADQESAVMFECTQADKPTKRSMAAKVQYVTHVRQGVRNSVRRFFGGKKLKLGAVIATRNIEWTKKDLERAENERIIVLRDKQLDYFFALADHLKYAARYQFLAHLFSGQRIAELQLEVPATQASMGGVRFYTFVIRPHDLLKRVFVAHRAGASKADVQNTYQRLISKQRLKKIADFIDGGGQFPTNIVVNIHTKKKVRFDTQEKIGRSAVGTLYLPSEYACAWVIDGQHRLFGYAHSKRSESQEDKSTFLVLAYDGLPNEKEAQMFIDINHEQKSVTTNLLKEIYSTLNWGSADFGLRTEALCSRLVLDLDAEPTSALHDRVGLQGKKKTSIRCLTLNQISEPLEKLGFFGQKRPNGSVTPGPLSESNSDTHGATFDKAYEALSELFTFIKETAPDQWRLGRLEGGFLATNMGVRSILGVFRHVLLFIEKRDDLSLDLLDPEDFMPAVKKLIKPLIAHFEAASGDEVRRFRDQVGMAGVRRNEFEMMRVIMTAEPEFTAKGLKEHIKNQDIEGTRRARDMIDDVNRRLSEFVTDALKNKYGAEESGWWLEVPLNIRKQCSDRREEDPKRHDPWQYLDLKCYRDIAHANWPLFQNYFLIDKQLATRTKPDQTMWIAKLNGYRQITHHPEKGYLKAEEVKEVEQIHKKAMMTLKVVEKYSDAEST